MVCLCCGKEVLSSEENCTFCGEKNKNYKNRYLDYNEAKSGKKEESKSDLSEIEKNVKALEKKLSKKIITSRIVYGLLGLQYIIVFLILLFLDVEEKNPSLFLQLHIISGSLSLVCVLLLINSFFKVIKSFQ